MPIQGFKKCCQFHKFQNLWKLWILRPKPFHHILKTRIHHDEQLSQEILDLIQKQDKIKDNGDSSSFPLNEQCHQANVCVCCDRFICGADELYWIKKKHSPSAKIKA